MDDLDKLRKRFPRVKWRRDGNDYIGERRDFTIRVALHGRVWQADTAQGHFSKSDSPVAAVAVLAGLSEFEDVLSSEPEGVSELLTMLTWFLPTMVVGLLCSGLLTTLFIRVLQ